MLLDNRLEPIERTAQVPGLQQLADLLHGIEKRGR
jgi:hypothetical protein